MPRLITTETTTEALARTMSQTAERALVASAEADALDVLLGRYSGVPNLGVWLKGYSGEPVRIDRRSRESDRLDRPVLSVAMTCQPEGAREMFGSRQARGRGLLARFLTIVPRSLVGERRTDPRPIPGDLRRDFHQRVRRLLDVELHPEPQLGPAIIRLDAEAQEVFWEFYAQLEPRLGASGDLADDCGWSSKLAGNLARITLVLLEQGLFVNSVNSVKGVPAETMLAALAWEPYLVAHQGLIQRTIGADPHQALAEKILKWIKKSELREFSQRDAYRACGQTADVGSVEKFSPGLHLLEDHGWILGRTGRTAGRGFPASHFLQHGAIGRRIESSESP